MIYLRQTTGLQEVRIPHTGLEYNGPAVLECKNYRFRGHFEGDQCAYRDAAFTEKWIAEHDCVKNFEAELVANGVLTEEEIAAQRAAFSEDLEQAVQNAEAAPAMTADEIYDGLYA